MANLTVNLNKIEGIIKPMNATNNGPTAPSVRGTSTFQIFKDLRIPYARLHDSSFHECYGQYSVDIHLIFDNFDADVDDPNSYDFRETDSYIKTIIDAGIEPFYRMGASIEHQIKRGTIPPKDYLKWAKICEHVIRHYTQGWANGFNYKITYWEIWNEPECINPDGSNPCWQGTQDEFCDFFIVVFKHLKSCFPELMIGGPSFCEIYKHQDIVENFFKKITAAGIKLDFFSFHRYAVSPLEISSTIDLAHDYLNRYGMKDTKTVLNEWNYIRGWLNDEYLYSLRSVRGLKGASFTLSTMLLCQHKDLDLLMYYDAAPSSYNTIYDIYEYAKEKGYYTYYAFAQLRELVNSLEVSSDDDEIQLAASSDHKKTRILLSYFTETKDDVAPNKKLKIDIIGGKGKDAKVFLVDNEHDLSLVSEVKLESDSLELEAKLFDSYLIELE